MSIKNSIQEEPLDFRCLTKICVVYEGTVLQDKRASLSFGTSQRNHEGGSILAPPATRPDNSGQVRSFHRRASTKTAPSWSATQNLAEPSRRNGDANVVSIARCAPCHRVSPSTATGEATGEPGFVDESCFWTWDDNEHAWQSRKFQDHQVKRQTDRPTDRHMH